ncbi:MAG: hypothetical protein J6J60_10215 [Clostridia bacterium]|nr:hypothetical protein [Clostridia bacterium]
MQMMKLAILAGVVEKKVEKNDELYIEARKVQEDIALSDFIQVAISLGRLEAKIEDREVFNLIKEMESILIQSQYGI